MKINLKKVVGMLSICVLATSAKAATIFQDNFDSYAQGNLPTNNFPTTPWLGVSGNPSTGPIVVIADPTASSANALKVDQALAQDVQTRFTVNSYAGITGIADVTTTNSYGSTTNTTYGFSSTNSVNALYASMTLYVTTIPSVASGSQTYFTHFTSDGSGFRARISIVTNGAASGKFRLAVRNADNVITNTIPQDFDPSTAYTLVSRYILGSASSTIWVNPVNESSGTSATALDVASLANINAYGYRQNSGEGVINVDNLLVGTSFADVVPSSINAPVIVTQPQDNTTVFVGGTVSFTNLALGDATITYQWYYNTNTLLVNIPSSISGATNRILILTNLTIPQTGTYSCVSSNAAGTNVTRFAALLVNTVPVPPTITSQPTNVTCTVGDTVAFSVTANGLPLPAYQWKVVPATNLLVTNIISGATAPTLTLANVTTNSSGFYFVTITNSSGYLITNSAKATLTVNPIALTNISSLHAQIDPVTFAPSNTTTLFKVRGIVTTWSDMTGVANTLFYMQDGTGGIPVFWSGANGVTNLPPAGALVEVVGPLTSFNGLLEISPVFTNSLHSVTVISTNNPLPVAQPLPIDPLFVANTAAMKKLEGTYFVASNVFLLNGPSFVSGANDATTNIATKVQTFTNSILTFNYTNGSGQTFVFFVNGSTDIPGQAKPSGPVTIYGVLGYFNTVGFEFTPSRYADIIQYVRVTNVLANARPGDLVTNSYTELVVRPGESLTTYMSIGDAAGGIVTVTPSGPLPTGAAWSGITSGATATAKFSYTGNGADAGTYFPIQLDVTSTAGTTYSQFFSVYVPTAQEQKMAITEILTTPTTNPAAPFYNPLARSAAVNGISTNDQYVEIVNQSDTDVTTKFTLDKGSAASPVFSSFDGFGTSLLASNALVVYGGDGSPAVTPGLAAPVVVSRGLFLAKTGSSVLVLRNASGYIIDRVVYTANATTNGSLSRFPTWASAIVPQPYVSTNAVTPGSQYDGGSWAALSKVPAGVSGIAITYVNGAAVLNFSASTTQASTLWNASDVSGPYSVLFGQPFPSGTGVFTNVNSASKQFYYISTQ